MPAEFVDRGAVSARGYLRHLEPVTPSSVGCDMPSAKLGLYFLTEMKLGEHPLVKSNWPPHWLAFYGPKVPITGELGVLEDIRLSSVGKKRCILLMEHEQTRYIAELQFDDEAFCQQFVKLVEPHSGKAIAQIGDLDIL